MINYCSACGAKVKIAIPADDNRERAICTSCDTIHYENPHVVTGVLPIWQDKVLLCRRAIEPRHGLWTLPAGFMENGETTAQGALREADEEANAVISQEELYLVASLPYIDQVYTMYRGTLDNLEFYPGIESLETQLFAEDEIPWDELAFKVVVKTLELYFEDRKTDTYPIRNLTFDARV